MCFAPQRHALFRLRSFQREPGGTRSGTFRAFCSFPPTSQLVLMQLRRAVVSALLLTIQGVDAVSSQRVASAGSKSGTGNPWFSLLTKRLDDLAKNIVELAKSGAPDETMVNAIESIRAIVHDMKGAVNDSHAVAQQQINQKAKAVASCQAPPHTDSDYLDRAIIHGENSIENVMTCRNLA
eukprot:s408_g33.t1